MAADTIVNPHVSTDRSVDSATVKTMVDSLVKPGMSSQDKALAIYNYVRRTMFHYRTYTKYGGGGAVNLINGTGYCLCTPTAGAQCELLEAAGLKARILDTRNHGSVVVFFDGKWHWMDAFLGGCLTGPDGKTLLDLADVVADPSLLKGEHTSPVTLLPCHDLLYADAIHFEPANKECQEGSGPDDFAWAAKSNPGKKTATYWTSSMTLDVALRPGESYVRSWDNITGMYFLHNTQDKFAPPHHFCGIEAEQRDTINWPYFKPYVKEITSFDPKVGKETKIKTGRYWANGGLSWFVGLESPDALKLFSRAENVKAKDGAIVVADASKRGVVELTVKCPYMLQDGRVTFLEGVDRAKVKLSISPDPNIGDKSPASQPDKPFSALPYACDDPWGGVSEQPTSADFRKTFAAEMGTRGYRLRFELSGADAALKRMLVQTTFQHNMYALPQLMPGKNEIKLTVANPEALAKTKFLVVFSYDGPDGKMKQEKRIVDKSPFMFTIDIPDGPDLPRMRSLRLANEE